MFPTRKSGTSLWVLCGVSSPICCLQAYDKIVLDFDIIGSDPPKEMLTKKETEIKEGNLLRIVGTIMHGFDAEPGQAKIRSLILPHVKELRALVGKDGLCKTLGAVLHRKVQDVLALK